MGKSGAQVFVDLSGIEKKFSASALKSKQAVFAQRVAFDMRKHVPVDEGTLRDSEPISSDYENGLIVWNTPYAKYVLNADSVRTVKNPDAVPNWPEVTKAEKLNAWKKFAANLIGSDGVSIGATND